jgi:histidinol-phosphate aminotransferase
MALRMLHHLDQVKASIEKVKTERNRLIKDMMSIPNVKPYPSEANFVFFKTTKLSRRVGDALAQKAILVRCYDSQELEHHLRMTIGTEEMNERFLRNLKEIALA